MSRKSVIANSVARDFYNKNYLNFVIDQLDFFFCVKRVMLVLNYLKLNKQFCAFRPLAACRDFLNSAPEFSFFLRAHCTRDG